MKILIAICLCGSVLLPAQTKLQTFTSPDGVFQFKHSDTLIDCMTERTEAKPASAGVPQVFVGHSAGPSMPDSCMSQAGICGSGDLASTLACLAYPKHNFEDKPTFIAAAFFVAEVNEATTAKECSEGSRYWNAAGGKVAEINGVAFEVFEVDDNWAGGGQGGPVYRTFHLKKCYELGIQTAGSRGGYDPETIKTFTKEDSDEVQSKLKQALNSFRFIK
jgi:hypothetical protein